MPHYEGELRAQPGLRYAIVASRWNPRIVDALVDGARRTLVANGIAAEAIDVFRVPGSWELPLAATGSRARRVTPGSWPWAAWCAATRATTSTWPTAAPKV
jgi:6,7-dimethyl-8-ribityllumazine synthase